MCLLGGVQCLSDRNSAPLPGWCSDELFSWFHVPAFDVRIENAAAIAWNGTILIIGGDRFADDTPISDYSIVISAMQQEQPFIVGWNTTPGPSSLIDIAHVSVFSAVLQLQGP